MPPRRILGGADGRSAPTASSLVVAPQWHACPQGQRGGILRLPVRPDPSCSRNRNLDATPRRSFRLRRGSIASLYSSGRESVGPSTQVPLELNRWASSFLSTSHYLSNSIGTTRLRCGRVLCRALEANSLREKDERSRAAADSLASLLAAWPGGRCSPGRSPRRPPLRSGHVAKLREIPAKKKKIREVAMADQKLAEIDAFFATQFGMLVLDDEERCIRVVSRKDWPWPPTGVSSKNLFYRGGDATKDLPEGPLMLLAPSQWHVAIVFSTLTTRHLPICSTDLNCYLEGSKASILDIEIVDSSMEFGSSKKARAADLSFLMAELYSVIAQEAKATRALQPLVFGGVQEESKMPASHTSPFYCSDNFYLH